MSKSMRISELAKRTGVTIATVKFYMREGLLPTGTPTSVTLAEYGQAHVDRLRLVRALVEVGGLSLSAVRQLLATLDAETALDAGAAGSSEAAKNPEDQPKADAKSATGRRRKPGKSAEARPPSPVRVLRAAQEGLPPEVPHTSVTPARALAAVSALGWDVDQDSVALRQLEGALVALDTVGLPPNISTLLAYAEAAMRTAQADAESMPTDSGAQIVRHIVVGSVMYDAALIALRRLAQQHVFKEL